MRYSKQYRYYPLAALNPDSKEASLRRTDLLYDHVHRCLEPQPDSCVLTADRAGEIAQCLTAQCLRIGFQLLKLRDVAGANAIRLCRRVKVTLKAVSSTLPPLRAPVLKSDSASSAFPPENQLDKPLDFCSLQCRVGVENMKATGAAAARRGRSKRCRGRRCRAIV